MGFLTLSTRQQALIDATSKSLNWRFRVIDKNANGYWWSTKTIAASTSTVIWDTDDDIQWIAGVSWGIEEPGFAYTFKIVDFDGIMMRRNYKEAGIISPNDLTLTILNKDNTLTHSDFKGGSIWISLGLDDGDGEEIVRRWRFWIKKTIPDMQKFKLVCEDFLQEFLRTDYPNTRLVRDIFPSDDTTTEDNVCLPVPFGTGYVPLRSVYDADTISVADTSISATASTAGVNCKFSDSNSGFGSIDPLWPITVAGFTDSNNNGTFTPLKVSATEIEVAYSAGLVTEAAGDSVTVAQGARPYILGSTSFTWVISKVRTPRGIGRKSEFPYSATPNGTTTFAMTQATYTAPDTTTWRALKPIIAEFGDNSGVANVAGYWREGVNLYDIPTKFTRSDTAAMTNPSDVIQFVLIDFGLVQDDLNLATFAAAKTQYTSDSLTFNGAFWYRRPRESVLAELLNQCHSVLVISEQVELHVLSKTSQATMTKANVIKTIAQDGKTEKGEVSQGTFRYADATSESLSDSGYISWQETDEPQDLFVQTLVPATGSAKTKPSEEILVLPMVQDSQDVQRIGKLYYQRKLLKEAEASFKAKSSLLDVVPEEVITINHADYGGNYAVIVDSMHIHKDIHIDMKCSKYSASLDDWGDLAPSAITIPDDDTLRLWEPSISGLKSTSSIGKTAFDVWGLPHLTVGVNTNDGQYTDIQEAINALAESRHNGIFLLNGTHTLSDAIYLPERDVEIIGESQGGVIVANNAGDYAFSILDRTKTFRFSTFTISSQNSGAGQMIRINGTTAAQNSATVLIDKLAITGYDDGSASGVGDDCITALTGTGKLTVSDCIFTSGKYGIDIQTYGDVIIAGNRFVNQKTASIYGAGTMNDILISNNQFVTFYVYGTNLSFTSANRVGINGNVMTGKAIGNAQYPIYSDNASQHTIDGNTITSGATGNNIVTGISIQNGTDINVVNNTLTTVITSTAITTGIYIYATVTDSIIKGNSISLDNPNTTANHYGIRTYGDRCVIAANNMDLVNNDAKDLGIVLENGADSNQGGDNITYRVGTSVTDNGAGNAVTALDV